MRTRTVLLGLFVFGVLSGCSRGTTSGETATVAGKVTLSGGRPLPGGRITFISAQAPTRLGMGIIKADGSYEATGVPLGECKVTVENAHLRGFTPVVGAGAGSMPGVAETVGEKYVPIAARFARPETSGLTTTVGDNTHTYDAIVK